MNNRGSILLIAVIFLGIFLTISTALVSYSTVHITAVRHAHDDSAALRLAEAGFDKAMYELNQNPAYAGENNTALGGGTFTIQAQTISPSQKHITVTASIPNSVSPRITKTISADANISGNIVSFHYAIQSGNGGFLMSGAGTRVDGSIYANGPIVATQITGSAVAANLPAATPDQTNDSPTPPPSSITFGNANGTADFAQSFVLGQSYSFNSIQFYIKKVGAPSNLTLRILYDNAGAPGSDVAGLTGTLNAALVTANYGWVTVTLPTSPVLTAGQKYWMILDGGANANNYYVIAANSAYASGEARVGKYNTSWPVLAGQLDAYFKVYLGGTTASISGGTIGTTADDFAWAHTVTGATVAGTLYCTSGNANNKACIAREDPPPQALPVSDGNIEDWETEAAAGGLIEGGYTVSNPQSLGPKKINGNLSVTSTLTLTGTVWVTGTITLSGHGTVQLDASYGPHDGVILSNKYVSLAGGSEFYGSGEPGSYPFLITTSSCPDDPTCGGANAISFSGGSGTVGLVAQNGTVYISGGSALKAVTGKTIQMAGGATLVYDSGLVNSNFTSGPGGSYIFVPGTYVIH